MRGPIIVKRFILFSTIFLVLLFFDRFLPTSKIETTVYSVDKSSQTIIYNVPLTGGGIDTCPTDEEVIETLRHNSPVVVETTAIFRKCRATLPSWPVDADKLIRIAVGYASYDNYANIEDLRRDYPGFTPRIRLWREDPWFMPASCRRYSVQLPEKLVIFDPDGNVRTTRTCGTVGGDCEAVAPIHPERGIVGTVQFGGPDYAVATDFEIEWPDNPEAIFFKSGHCFSAYSQSSNWQDLIIRPKGARPMYVTTGFGFFLVAGKGEGFAVCRISRELFDRSRSCSSDAKAAWPNVGGAAWKR